ncbi:hypothetical protein ALQ65_04537 [Pseudomonas syringae pv. coriandricola]|uniref:Uncharacterized protein n=1 Tax=Pseudomonas syringae pv. coriandricola TaxID=264453 RepID=A0A3M3JG74_9PSED|nr:hypothetical protein ALQ65_04537 [Pseudomonas syringae pv. coriandricola]
MGCWRGIERRTARSQATFCEHFTGLEVHKDLGFCPQGVGADSSAMGCVAVLKQATLVVSGAPKQLVLLPVPGS